MTIHMDMTNTMIRTAMGVKILATRHVVDEAVVHE